MKIECVLFDLGNTLVSYFTKDEFRPVLRKSINNCCEAMTGRGHALEEQEIFEKALEMTGERPDLAVHPLIDRLQILFKGNAIAHQAVLIPAFMEPIFATAKPDPDALTVLTKLRQLGLKTGILSNTPWGSPAAVWHSELQRHGLAENVDLTLFCVDVGWRKPHGAIFSEALARLQVRPQATLFVGDDLRWDIEGSRDAGLVPVLLDPHNLADRQPHHTIKHLADLPALVQKLSA